MYFFNLVKEFIKIKIFNVRKLRVPSNLFDQITYLQITYTVSSHFQAAIKLKMYFDFINIAFQK